MNRLIPLMLIVSLGCGAACRQSARPAVVASVQPSPTPSLTEFEPTGEIEMYSEDYRRRSDGALLQFGCQDHVTASAALAVFRDRVWDVHITPVIDLYGAEIGKRFATYTQPEEHGEIVWNEGARLFYIDAPSLQDALTFERSNVWKDSGCWDFRPWDRATEQIVGREPR